MRRRRFLQITAAAAVLPRGAQAGEWRWRGVALGAEADVLLRGEGRAAQAVLATLPALLERVEAEFSLYRADSALSRLNATGRLEHPSASFRALCALTDALHRATEGAFDPTVQPLWRALADGGDVAAAARLVGWDRVRRDKAITLEPGQALTFNGLAQGHATDAVRSLLAQAGFVEALVHIGEFAALGGPWRLAVGDPAAGILAERQITGGAVATSSPGALMIGGRAHILHPQALPPLWSSVTVEAETAALADGLATALVFAPLAAIPVIRARLSGVGRVTLVDAAGNLMTV